MDNNKYNFAGQTDLYIDHLCFEGSPVYDDTVKLSRSRSITFNRVKFDGGGCRENSVDLNNGCSQVTFKGCDFWGGEQACVVVKGGCKQIVFDDCVFKRARSAWIHVLVDGYSDQSKEYSTVTLINCCTFDGSALRVAYGRKMRPVSVSTRRERVISGIYSLGLHLYNRHKDWVVARSAPHTVV